MTMIKICAHCGGQFLLRESKYCKPACGYAAMSRANTVVVTYELLNQHSIPEPNSGCWLWLGSLNRELYARISHTHVARPVLEIKLGRRMARKEVTRHTCDNPSCVNPDHLVAGSDADNAKDRSIRGRVARGSRQGLAKLTEGDIPDIVARRNRGEAVVSIAAKFGVAPNVVTHVMKGRTWGHISGIRSVRMVAA